MRKRIYTNTFFENVKIRSKTICLAFLCLLIGSQLWATTYYSKSTATDFNDVNSWGTATDGTGTSPASLTNADDYVIQNGSVLSLSGNASVRSLKIGGTTAGTLNIASNTLTIEIATQNNTEFIVNSGGQLNQTGGTIIVNGAMYFADGSGFNQTAGLMSVDGNSGTPATSVGGAMATAPIFAIGQSSGTSTSAISTAANAAKFTLTGGTIQIVDPTAGTGVQYCFRVHTNYVINFGANHTIKYGDGVSTQAGGNATNGFYTTSFPGTSYGIYGNVVCDVLTGTNRFVNTQYSQGIQGNFTVTSGEYKMASIHYFNKDVTINGTLTAISTAYFGNFYNATVAPTTNAQTVSGSGVIRNLASAPTANFTSVTINNSSATGINITSASAVSGTGTGTVSSTFTLLNGLINTNGNTFTLGTSATALGTLAYTAGGFSSGSTFSRWIGTAGTGTTIAASTVPTFGVGSFPFVISDGSGGFLARHFHRNTAALTTGGKINVKYVDGSGLATLATSVIETVTIDKQSNAQWIVSNTSTVGTAAATYCIQANNLFYSTTVNQRLLNNSGLFGTHQAGTNLPMVQRTAIPVANQFATFTIGAVSSDIPINTVKSGAFNDPTVWSSGSVPPCGSLTVISAADSVYVDASQNVTTGSISNLGRLSVIGGTLTLGCNNNDSLVNAGKLYITSGALNVNGKINNTNASTFTQSGGDITVNGNSGVVGTSVATGSPLVWFQSNKLSLTGGNIKISNPHIGTATSDRAITYSPTASPYPLVTTGHTLILGNGTSTLAGGTNGFSIGQGTRFQAGNLNVNIQCSPNVKATTSGNFVVHGNLTITKGRFDIASGNSLYVGGSIINNDSLISVGTLYLAKVLNADMSSPLASPDSIAQTIGGTGLFLNSATGPTANFSNMSILNYYVTGGVSFNPLNQVGSQPNNSTSVSGTFSFSGGKATTLAGSNFVLGIPNTSAGTLTYSGSGGFTSGSTFAWALTPTTTGTILTAGTDPTTSNLRFPFISSDYMGRSAWLGAVTPSVGGVLGIKYEEIAGNTTTNLADASGYVVQKYANDSWKPTSLGSSPAAASYQLGIVANNIFGIPLSADSTRILQSSGFKGTHQKGTITPGGQRIGLSLTDLTSDAFFIGINNAEIPNISIASGDWSSPSTWSKNTVPVCTDKVTIASGHTVTVNSTGNQCAGLTINLGGTLTSTSGDLTVGCTNNNALFQIASGTYNMNGGLLTVNGKFSNNSTNGSFIQTGGDIIVDGNSGVLATSTPTHVVDMYALDGTKINLTGGTFTVVDPPISSSTGYGAFKVYPTNAFTTGPNWTLKLGDGVSTTPGGNSDGFLINLTNTNSMVIGGNVIVNTQGSSWSPNRHVTTANAIGIKNLTITKGDYRLSSVHYISGNLTNNDTFSHYSSISNLQIGAYSGAAATPSNNPQTISGTGVFRNSLTNSSVSANMIGLITNNSNTTGITLDVPLSISGTLTMTSGIINTTATNLLQLGTATSTATLSCTPSTTNYINGPFARTFGSSRTATGTYTVATLFPVGKSGSVLPIYLDPSTSATGSVIYTSEAFATFSGTAGTGVSNVTTKYWSALPTSGSANLTGAFLRLQDNAVTSTSKIITASSASGTYNGLPSGSSSSAGANTTSSVISSVADLLGYYSYGDLQTCTSPVDQATGLTFSNKTTTTLSLAFTAASSNPTGYLVVRYPNGSAVTTPTDALVYTSGATLGLGTVIGTFYSAPFNINQTGLAANTSYDYYVYAFNNSGCSGPAYNITSPLFGNVSTCPTSIVAPTAVASPAYPFTNLTSTGFTINWVKSTTTTVNDNLIDISTNSNFTSFVPGFENASMGPNPPYNVTGLDPGTSYFVRIKAAENNCTSSILSFYHIATLPNTAVSTFYYNFDTSPSGTNTTVWPSGTARYPAVGVTTTYPNITATNFSAPNSVYLYGATSYTSQGILVLPQVNNSNAGTHRINLKYSVGTASVSGQFGYLTNPSDPSTFVQIGSNFTKSVTSVWDSVFINLPSTLPNPITLAVRNSGLVSGSLYIDNIAYEPIPAPVINNVTSSNICGISTKVVITGTNLNSSTAVTIGGVSLLPLDSSSSTRLVKTISTPFNGTTSVSTGGGTATNNTNISYLVPPVLNVDSPSLTFCSGSSGIISVTSALTDYDTYTWSPSAGVSGSAVATFNPTISTVYTLNASNSTTGCNTSLTRSINVNPLPLPITITPVDPTICAGSVQQLTASGGTNTAVTIMSENFNAATNNWTLTNNSSGGTPANAAWTLRSDGYIYSSYGTWHSNDSTQFIMSNSDAQGSNGVTSTILASPAFNTTNFQNVSLSFYHYFYESSSASSTGAVEASTDGTTWTPLSSYIATTGSISPFSKVTIPLTAAFINQPVVYVRFKFNGTYRYFWGIDNVSITGVANPSLTWTPTTDLYTDTAATVPYTGTALSTVYSKPTSNITYTVNSQSQYGCTTSKSTNVTVITPLTLAVNSPSMCGSIATTQALTVVPTGGSPSTITYTWSPLSDLYTDSAGTVAYTGLALSSPTIYTKTSNSRTYTVTAQNGCTPSPTAVSTVTINPIPVATATNNGPVCDGTDVTLTGASSVTGSTFSWTGPSSYTSTTQSPTITAATASNAGTYKLTVTANGCTSTVDSSVVVVNAIPVATATNNGPVCDGTDVTLTGASSVTGSTFSWTGPSSYTSTTQSPTITAATASNAGTYKLTVTANGCTSAVDSSVVVVNAIPVATASNNGPVCDGTDVTLTGASSVTGSTFSWTGPNSYTSTTQSPTITAATASNAGTYKLTVTANGCTSAVDSSVVVVNAIPVATASNNGPVCDGTDVTLTGASSVTGSTFSWTGPNSYTSTTQSPTIIAATTSNAGTYKLTVTANGCTSAVDSSVVVVNAIPVATASNNGPVCDGIDVTLTGASSVTGSTFSWTGPNSYTSTTQSPTITAATASNAGTYKLTVTANGCTSAVDSSVVVVNALPGSVSVTPNAPISNCGIAAPLTATSSNSTSMVWSPTSGLYTNAAATTPYTGGSAYTVYAAPATTSTYTPTATTADGCSTSGTNSGSVSVTVTNVNTNATLITNSSAITITNTNSCTESNGWTYYLDPNNTSNYLFGINWGTGNSAAANTASVILSLDTANGSSTQTSPNKEGLWTMKRYWNVTTSSALVNPVSIRFFYSPADLSSIQASASAFATANGISGQTTNWFKTVGIPFNPATGLTPTGVTSSITLSNSNTTGATLNGISYAQFDGISSFSGGTAMVTVSSFASLPIELVNLSVQNDHQSNILNWQTGNENGLEKFDLQRSANGRTFENLATLTAHGNNSSYKYIDNPALIGDNYYRLQMHSKNQISYSAVVFAKVFVDGFSLQVWPNPAKGNINLKLGSNPQSDASVDIIDAMGKLVKRTSIVDKQTSLDISELSDGFYIMYYTDSHHQEQIRFEVR